MLTYQNEDWFCSDDIWDSHITWYTNRPRITNCFRDSLLIPASAFILILVFLPIELINLSHFRHRALKCTHLNVVQMLLYGALFASQLFQIINSIDNKYSVLGCTVLACFTQLLEINGLIIIVCKLFRRGLVTTAPLALYFLLRVCCETLVFVDFYFDDQITRTPDQVLFAYTRFLSTVALLLVHSFAPRGPANVLNRTNVSAKHRTTPEDTCCPASVCLFHWVWPVLCLGWNQKLKIKHIHPLCLQNNQANLLARLNRLLGHHCDIGTPTYRSNKQLSVCTAQCTTKHGLSGVHVSPLQLLWLLIRIEGLLFILYTILRFVSIALDTTTTQLLECILAYIGSEREFVWHGVFWALVMAANRIINNILLSMYYKCTCAMSIRIKLVLGHLIYRKMLFLSAASRIKRNSGEISNLISVDVVKISKFIIEGSMFLNGPVQLAFCVYLLHQQLGYAAYASLVVIFLLLPLNGVAMYYSQKLERKEYMQADNRIKVLNELLSGIRAIKLLAWEKAFEKYVANIRIRELKFLKKVSLLDQSSWIMYEVIPLLISVICLGIYVLSDPINHVLTPRVAFVSLNVINLMYETLTFFPHLVYTTITAFVSFMRIARLMNSEELDGYVQRNPDDNYALTISETVQFVWNSQTSVANCDKKVVENGKSAKVGFENKCTDEVLVNNRGQKKQKTNERDVVTFALKNVGLKVKKGEFIAIIGPVGSGKSSLLSAMLGEMQVQHVSKDQQMVEDSVINIAQGLKVAYVPQQAWLQNATFKQNVQFGQCWDERRFKYIVNACQLLPDIHSLTAGTETEIGESGVNLSGGQKQRVSFARACYSNADLYLLDDPLSAVDAHVSTALFHQVLSNKSGLLRHKTRILVTNDVRLLPHVQRIVVLKDGVIKFDGTYQELLKEQDSGVDLSDYGIKLDCSEQLADDQSPSAELIQLEQYHFNQLNCSDQFDAMDGAVDAPNISFCESISSSEDEFTDVQDGHLKQDGRLIQEEKIAKGKVKASHYILYFKSLGWKISAFSVFTFVCHSLLQLNANFYLVTWSKTDEGQNDLHSVHHHLLIYSSMGLGHCIFMFASFFAMIYASLNASIFFHKQLFHSVLRSPMKFFESTPVGRVVNRFSQDIDVIDSCLPTNIRYFAEFFMIFLCTLYVIFTEIPIMIVGMIPVIVAFYMIQKLFVVTSRQIKRFVSKTQSPIYSQFGESLAGAQTIRAYNRITDFVAEADRRQNRNNCCSYESIITNRWLQAFTGFLSNAIITLVSIYLVLYANSGYESIAGLLLTYTITLNYNLMLIIRTATDIENNMVSVERIAEYLDNEHEASWESKGIALTSGWPGQGDLEFDSLSARYRPELNLALNQISFQIRGGEKIGIVGRSGSGKSSIAMSLFRLIEPAEGCIKIDGINVNTLGLHDLRSRITIIPQDPTLFSESVRFNLDPFDEYTDDRLWTALKLCHLGKWLANQPAGLMTQVGEKGQALSVGQRQLLCLARAILKHSKILVLDEATASVDQITDSLVQDTIRSEFADCTLITIAHRLNTISDSNRILVLDKGVVAEFDTPEHLKNNPDSFYYLLLKQAGLNNHTNHQ